VNSGFPDSWRDLRHYIFGLQSAGFDVSPSPSSGTKKIAYPLIAPISMLSRFPSLSSSAAAALSWHRPGHHHRHFYWAIAALLEAMGGIGNFRPCYPPGLPTSSSSSSDYILLKMVPYLFPHSRPH